MSCTIGSEMEKDAAPPGILCHQSRMRELVQNGNRLIYSHDDALDQEKMCQITPTGDCIQCLILTRHKTVNSICSTIKYGRKPDKGPFTEIHTDTAYAATLWHVWIQCIYNLTVVSKLMHKYQL